MSRPLRVVLMQIVEVLEKDGTDAKKVAAIRKYCFELNYKAPEIRELYWPEAAAFLELHLPDHEEAMKIFRGLN